MLEFKLPLGMVSLERWRCASSLPSIEGNVSCSVDPRTGLFDDGDTTGCGGLRVGFGGIEGVRVSKGEAVGTLAAELAGSEMAESYEGGGGDGGGEDGAAPSSAASTVAVETRG